MTDTESPATETPVAGPAVENTNNTAPVLLVDGSAFLFRAFYGMPNLTAADGFPTGAIRGVISMLRKLQLDYPDSQTVAIFDAKGKTFRDDLYSEYKANRDSMPDDLVPQIEPIHQIIKAMGYPLVVIPGVEADDVIGTLAVQLTAQNRRSIIVSGDKDLTQLIDKNVTMLDTMKDLHYDSAVVQEKFGVAPNRIIDYLALVGDSADNIPGVPKVGPKTAVKWLGLYDDVEDVINHADEIKGKVGENLRNNIEQLRLSYVLATVKLDVELDFKLEDLQQADPDTATLAEFYKRYEFKSWLQELSSDASSTDQDDTEVVEEDNSGAIYQVILKEQDLIAWCELLASSEYFAFDTETTSVNYMQADLVGMSFAVKPGFAAYLPIAHDYAGAPEQLDLETVLKHLQPILEDQQTQKIGQNIKYDISVMARYGVNIRGVAFDTMLLSYVLDSTHRHDMDSMALRFLQHETIRFEDVAGKGVKQKTFNQIELEVAAPYAAEDADITLQLYLHLWAELEAHPGLQRLFIDMELPLLQVLSKVERNGALLDTDKLLQQSIELGQRLTQLETQAHDLAGEVFNLGSPKQLQQIFYTKLQLPVLKKTPKGQPSTAEPVLQDLAKDFDLPKVILEHRSLAKLKSTYTDKLPLQVDKHTGRVHTSYQQAVAQTGRLSSTNPNLQNIPIRSEEGRRIRQAFIAADGNIIIAADYSQIELRIMAHLSQDPGLCDAFAHDGDVHSATAAEVFEVAVDEVSSDQRRSAKAINFGLIYGMSAFGLANQLDVSRKQAQAYIDAYFERYTGVRDYMDDIRRIAVDQGYVETLFGRRLYLPEINSRNGMRRQAAERAAINAPMQGTAADIIKRAMIQVDQYLDDPALSSRMVMQVHDELVLEVPVSEAEVVSAKVVQLMSDAAELSVPLIVEVGQGDNWEQAH